MSPRIPIKPLSVNKAWQGRRFKTDRYNAYEGEVKRALYAAGKVTVPDGELVAVYEFGLSSKCADWDNPIKPLQDILQKVYSFDDRRIVQAVVTKTLVAKGDEFFSFEFLPASEWAAMTYQIAERRA